MSDPPTPHTVEYELPPNGDNPMHSLITTKPEGINLRTTTLRQQYCGPSIHMNDWIMKRYSLIDSRV